MPLPLDSAPHDAEMPAKELEGSDRVDGSPSERLAFTTIELEPVGHRGLRFEKKCRMSCSDQSAAVGMSAVRITCSLCAARNEAGNLLVLLL